MGLGGADKGPGVDRPAGLVQDLGRPPETECVARGVHLDHVRFSVAVAEPLDLRLEVRLVFLGYVVLGVLLEVTELPRRVDAPTHRPATIRLELLELGLQRLEPLSGDPLCIGPICGHAGIFAGRPCTLMRPTCALLFGYWR